MAAQARLAPCYDELGVDDPPAPSASPPFDEARLAAPRAAPRIGSFHFGLPAPALLPPLKDAGITILTSATSPKEAMALETSLLRRRMIENKTVRNLSPARQRP